MAKMSFEKSSYSTNYNLWGLPSVIMGKREDKYLRSSYAESCHNIQTNHALYKTLHRLVANKPDWKFEIHDTVVVYSPNADERKHVAYQFRIWAGKVMLGEVEIVTRGEREYIRVHNEKIQAEVKRGKGYNTTDPEKAEKEIRRMFITPSLNEKLNKEIVATTEIVDSVVHKATDKRNQLWASLEPARTKFVQSKFDEFVSMLTTVNDVTNAADYKTATEERSVILRMRDAWSQRDSGKALLVVLDGSQYIVRYASEVKLFDADSVPADVRVKVGMLKLTEPQQVVDGLGVKVSNEVFIVTNTDVVME